MADKAISELVAAPSVTPDSLFVLQQDGTAKKLTAHVLENWLVSLADGHGGIQSIVKKSTSGLVDTYRITLADTTTFDFMVTNGKGINSVSKVSTSGLVDTYRIAFNDGTSSTFTVTNGEKGDKGDRADIWVKYASQKPTASSHSFGDVPDSWIGIATGHNMDTAPTGWQQYTWFQWKGEKGDTGDPATLISAEIRYQVGDSGTIMPSGSWSESVPPVTSGKFLWTRQVLQFNTGAPITSYSISRFGIDGTGSVSTVAGISPDAAGNVSLSAADVKALPIGGGTMEGSINMNGQKITGLNAPTQSNEVATKGYVDNAKPNLTGYATETYVNNSVGSKVDKSSVVNNFTTTEEGFVADARALKLLSDWLSDFSFILNHIFIIDNSGSSSVKNVKISSETCTFFAFVGGGSIYTASVSWNSNIGNLDLTGQEDIYGRTGINASYSNKVTTLAIPAWSTCMIITTTPGTLVG